MQPIQLWCGDITTIQTHEGWLYLAVVIDLFRRQVVGWSLQSHLHTDLVKDALAMAWWRRRPPPGLIFHSDRGSQYCSHEFQQALKDWGMRSSMSRKGNCWENKRSAVSRPQGEGEARHNAPTQSFPGAAEGDQREWAEICDPRAGQAGGDGLGGLLQSS